MTAALDTTPSCGSPRASLRWGERDAKTACALQPLDLEILVR